MKVYPFEKKSVVIDGFHYNFVETGKATAPTLFFLHNGGGDHRCWYYQLRELADSFHCVALDLPGFGESTRPENDYTVSWIAGKTQAFMRHQFKTPVVLIGHCIGGSVGMELTENDSSLTQRLLLVNVCGGLRGMSDNTRRIYRLMSAYPALLRKIYPLFKPIIGSKYFLSQSLAQLFRDPSNLENAGVVYETHVSTLPEQHISRKNLVLGISSFSKYSRPFVKQKLDKIPIEMIWGETNPVMTPVFGRWLGSYLGRPIHWMENSQHMPMSEEWSKFNAIVRAFSQVREESFDETSIPSPMQGLRMAARPVLQALDSAK